MAYIYKNSKGIEVSSWSYSTGQTFGFCRRKFKLAKKDGWRSKGDTAASKFGVAVEDAIQHFHADGLKAGCGVDHFKYRWLQFKEVPNLVYKEKEGDWKDFYQAGSELLALYELSVPSLPFVNPQFQLRYAKEVFPGTELAGITDQGFTDMHCSPPWDHPLLPKLPKPANAQHRPLIVDIKVSGKGLDATPGMLRMDKQLRRYAWQSGILDVAFLWLHRSKPNSYEKGVEVTFLEPSGKWTPLQQAVVLEYDSETRQATVTPKINLVQITKELDEIKGKGTKERRKALLDKWLLDDVISVVPVSAVTKQKLTFTAVRMSQEAVLDEGRLVGKDIVEARQAQAEEFWPETGAGVRFPNQNCVWCEMRGICLDDPKLRDNLLVQITPAPEADWLDQISEDE